MRKKGSARDKGNRQGLAKYFFQKSFFGQGAESVAEMEIGKHRRTGQRLLRADTPAFSEKRRLPFVESRLVHRREPAMAGGSVQRLFSNGRSLGILLSLFVAGQATLLEPCVLLTLFHMATVAGMIAVLGVERFEEARGRHGARSGIPRSRRRRRTWRRCRKAARGGRSGNGRAGATSG